MVAVDAGDGQAIQVTLRANRDGDGRTRLEESIGFPVNKPQACSYAPPTGIATADWASSPSVAAIVTVFVKVVPALAWVTCPVMVMIPVSLGAKSCTAQTYPGVVWVIAIPLLITWETVTLTGMVSARLTPVRRTLPQLAKSSV